MENSLSFLSDPLGELLVRLAVSVCIGFLIGLEREFSKPKKEKQFAGVRTYTLVALFGFISALLGKEANQWLLVAALVCLVALVTVSYTRLSHYPDRIGGTSEVALIITFLLAVLTFYDYILVAIIITVVILLLLAFKPPLHLFIKRMTREELLAIIQFIIISVIIIPFLPDKDFGPYNIWNLKNIWTMVALVSGISLAGYLLSKILGNRGTILSGILGGLVSSTMISLIYSKRSKETSSDNASFFYVVAILGACTVMFARILLEVYVLNPSLAKALAIPLALIVLVGVGVAFFIHKLKDATMGSQQLPLDNPLNFSMAIKFALIYACVLWLVQFFNDKFGESGTYVAGIMSGIADVDAITISMSKSGLDNVIAAKTILFAALSNTIVKLIIILSLGSNVVRKWCAIGLGAVVLAGIISFPLLNLLKGGT